MKLLTSYRVFVGLVVLGLQFQSFGPHAAQAEEPQRENRVDVCEHGATGDGLTDDTAAIDRAIAMLADDGGTLYFPSGKTYITTGGHHLASNTKLLASGAVIQQSSRLPDRTANTGHLFMAVDGTKNLQLHGGIYDLNRDAFRDRERKGLTLSAFYLRRHTGVTIRNVTIRNGPENALKLWNVRDVSIDNCRFENFYNNIIEFNNPQADGAPTDTPAPESGNYSITDCYFQDVDDFLNGAGNGCGVAVAGTVLQPHQDVRIEGNTFVGCNRAIWFETEGNDMEVDRVSVKRNMIVGSITGVETLHGIGLVGVKHGTIEQNTILNVASTSKTVSDPAGITVSGSATVESSDLILRNNIIRDLRANPNNHMRYGILLSRGIRLTVTNNLITGANAKQILVRPQVQESNIRDNVLE